VSKDPGVDWARPGVVSTASHQRMGPDTTARQRDKSPRSQAPELNVVTNFTPPTMPAKGSGINMGIKLHSRQESLQMRRNMSKRVKNRDGMKGPIGSLRRADSNLLELSPSDGTLLIGLSIPSADFFETRKHPQGLDAMVHSLAVPKTVHDKNEPMTPEIVITPAKLEELWPASQNKPEGRGRRRAVSSIYSQATQHPPMDSKVIRRPPMPSIPSESLAHGGQLSSSEYKPGRQISRMDSWGTEIDDDASPEIPSRPRAYSGESQLYMVKRSSGDTIATRHRSKGWWNQIVSPFLDRSNTTMTKNSMMEDDNGIFSNKDMKIPFTLSPDSIDQHKLPMDHDRNTRDSGRTSIWTDMTDWEAERRTMDLTNGLHIQRAKGEKGDFPTIGTIMSPEFEPVAGFGLASEYYEACWHDENSPTPFFKCENHDCSLLRSTARHPMVEDDDARDLYKPPFIMAGDTMDGFRQLPANRFSAAFAEAQASKRRPMSDATEIEEDLDNTPEVPDITPEVKEARAAPVIRARSPIAAVRPPTREASNDSNGVVMPEPKQKSAQAYQPQPSASEKPHIAVVPPERPRAGQDDDSSPGAVTPGLQKAVSSKQALPMSQLSKGISPPPPQYTNIINQYYGRNGEAPPREPITAARHFPPPPTKAWSKADEKRCTKEKEDDGRMLKGARHSRDKTRPALGDAKAKKKKRRRCYCFIIIGLLAMIALVLALCLTLIRKHSDMPVQSSWLNITGYPPIPTGISTIAQPDAVVGNRGCVQPATLWSCALPKEQQASIAPNDPDQPNFRVEIRFNNGTGTTSRRVKRSGNAVSAGAAIRNGVLRIRDAFIDSLYTPKPAPPSQEDQVFLGNTTDGNAAPFDGEYTPFFMSFIPTTGPLSRLLKRQAGTSNTTDPFPNITNIIPSPALNSDGTAAAATLLPLPSAQPLRLYNRGLPTEHYGFYSYFDRSIFLKANILGDSLGTEVPDDQNGGAPETAATVRCTWTQTRFLVQIWTKLPAGDKLLPRPSTTTASAPTATSSSSNTTSSASDFTRPGSFPYPVSITVDRHGGDITKKMIYCYTMDSSEQIVSSQKKIYLEDRGFGGQLVNPAMGIYGNVNVSLASGGPGGVDGGTGGCGCQWRNWDGRA
jgi:hypothetical protein